MSDYIVNGGILNDGIMYKHGEKFPVSDEKIVAELRNAGALKTPAELLPPQSLDLLLQDRDAELTQVRDELAQAQAELVQLREALTQSQAKRKSE